MIKKYLLIAVIMSAAFLFSSYAATNIFVVNTPRVNRNYLTDLQKQFRKNINNVYLAFSNIGWKNTKKDVAITYPTPKNLSGIVPINHPDTNVSTIPTQIPIVNNKPAVVAGVNVLSIPENLFKSISKGVSAYEATDNKIILRLVNGTILKTKKFTLPDGRTFEAIDFSGQ